MTQPPQGEWKIKLTGAGVEIDQEVTAEVGRRITVLVLTGEDNGVPGNPPLHGHRSGKNGSPSSKPKPETHKHDPPPLSMGEYLDQVEANTNPKKIAAIGQFLREHRNKDTFNADDIIQGFEESHENTPQNVSRDLGVTKNKNWISPKNNEAGMFYLTSTGKKAIDDRFKKTK